MSTTRLYLVRHGATQLTAEDRFSGGDGVELSDEGRWQAARLGDGPAVDAIATRDGLREISHGRGEGLTRREVEARYADEYSAWEQDPFTFAPEGGESGVAVLARALPVLREIVTGHPDQRVLVVSHKATIRLLLCSLLGVAARGYRDRLDQAPACLNVLDFRDPVRARLMLFNDTSHYAGQTREAEYNLSRWWDRGGG